jgi:uncharacterized protein
MTIDISDILKELGGRKSVDVELDLSDVDFLGENYKFVSPVTVKGYVSNNGESFILRADCSAKVQTQCGRCMKDIVVPVDFSVDENLMQNNGEEIADEDVIVFDGTAFELDEIIVDDFLLNVNGRYLCKDDCKGLCPKCGADLNEGDCGCEEDNIDPRWAGLLDIMKNEK